MTSFAPTSCGHCRYFAFDHGDVTGVCRRYAPRPGAAGANAHGDPQWPHVHATRDWCGEFCVSAASARTGPSHVTRAETGRADPR
ncbi:MAG: hypothetical protein MI723_09345 [Caulobacterales bacterium]|nr:hypothetical protein [Caulobacterales bacterium]